MYEYAMLQDAKYGQVFMCLGLHKTQVFLPRIHVIWILASHPVLCMLETFSTEPKFEKTVKSVEWGIYFKTQRCV